MDTLLTQQNRVIDFNNRYKQGCVIQLLDDYGNKFYAEVTHGAHVMPSGIAVVYLHGKGAYDLKRVISKF